MRRLLGTRVDTDATAIYIVDLDNIAFHDGVSNSNVLKRRVRAIQMAVPAACIQWFCNVDTVASLVKWKVLDFPLPTSVHVTRSEKDSADHALVHYILTEMRGRKHKAIVVTSDRILMRLIGYECASHSAGTRSRI